MLGSAEAALPACVSAHPAAPGVVPVESGTRDGCRSGRESHPRGTFLHLLTTIEVNGSVDLVREEGVHEDESGVESGGEASAIGTAAMNVG